jgi:hypothetical protein
MLCVPAAFYPLRGTGDLILNPGLFILVPGGVDMAGRIALGIAVGVLLFLFGYSVHREKVRSTEIPFRVAQYVETGNSADGIEAPFTVIVYEKRIQKIVPGYVAPVDDVVWVPEPK